jgi:hypothetical protein
MELLSRDWEVYLTHTLREVNSHADFLAKHVAQNLSEFCIWKDSPSRLNALMLVDSSYGYLLSLKSDLVYSYFSTVPKKNVRTRLNLCIRSWNVRLSQFMHLIYLQNWGWGQKLLLELDATDQIKKVYHLFFHFHDARTLFSSSNTQEWMYLFSKIRIYNIMII